MAEEIETDSTARAAVEAHVALWNAGEKARWLALFAENVVYEELPGKGQRLGHEAVSQLWERSFTATHRWVLEPTLLLASGQEAVVHMRNHGVLGDRPVWLDSLELYAVDADGLITSMKDFWEAPNDPSQSGLSLNEQQDPTT
jgi:ketosteroid isomerase-like protein